MIFKEKYSLLPTQPPHILSKSDFTDASCVEGATLKVNNISGCTVKKVSDESVSDIFDTIRYVDNNLSNTYMDGYSLYIPKVVKIMIKVIII